MRVIPWLLFASAVFFKAMMEWTGPDRPISSLARGLSNIEYTISGAEEMGVRHTEKCPNYIPPFNPMDED